MKTGILQNKLQQTLLSRVMVMISVILLSACSMTSVKSLKEEPTKLDSSFKVVIETNCDYISYGGERLLDSSKTIEQTLTDYGFTVVDDGYADFLFHFMCRKESDLNFGILPNDISAMLMTASIALIPTYWPSDLWVDMDVYDLRGSEPENVDVFKTSHVSQERLVWAPFFLFKVANEFGVDKYKYHKFYEGIKRSTQSLIQDAQAKAIFE